MRVGCKWHRFCHRAWLHIDDSGTSDMLNLLYDTAGTKLAQNPARGGTT